jgi:hypothetical protein
VSIYTIVCAAPNQWVVVEDEGFIGEYRGIRLRPASARSGEIVFGPKPYNEAMTFIANRNHDDRPLRTPGQDRKE